MSCGNIDGWFKSLGMYGYLLVGIFIVIAGYFIIVHQEHLAAYSGIIFIVIIIGLHLVVCGRGHGSHGDKAGGCGGGGSHGEHDKKDEDIAGAGTTTATKEGEGEKEKEQGGSCH